MRKVGLDGPGFDRWREQDSVRQLVRVKMALPDRIRPDGTPYPVLQIITFTDKWLKP